MIASSQAGNVKSTYRPRRAPPSHHKHTPNYPTRLNSIASESGSTGTNDENRLIKLNSLNSNEIHPNDINTSLQVGEVEGDGKKCFLRSLKNRIIETIKNISNKKDEDGNRSSCACSQVSKIKKSKNDSHKIKAVQVSCNSCHAKKEKLIRFITGTKSYEEAERNSA